MTAASGPRDLLGKGFDGVSARVTAIAAGRWNSPSPCDAWTVRDVVNHLVYEHLWVPHLLRGETIAQVGDRYDGDMLGDDPVGAWRRASAVSCQAWAALPADDVVVNLSGGEAPAAEYANQMLLDLVVHGWDIARGSGLDERMDADCVTHVSGYVSEDVESWRAAAIFGPEVTTTSADPQDRLLALLGRRP